MTSDFFIIRNETIGKQNDRAHLCGNFQARDSSKDDAALMDITKWIVDCRSCNCVCCATTQRWQYANWQIGTVQRGLCYQLVRFPTSTISNYTMLA